MGLPSCTIGMPRICWVPDPVSCPGAVEGEGREIRAKLGLVVGIGDVHHPAGGSHVPGDALLVDRQADFPSRARGEGGLRVELFLAGSTA